MLPESGLSSLSLIGIPVTVLVKLYTDVFGESPVSGANLPTDVGTSLNLSPLVSSSQSLHIVGTVVWGNSVLLLWAASLESCTIYKNGVCLVPFESVPFLTYTLSPGLKYPWYLTIPPIPPLGCNPAEPKLKKPLNQSCVFSIGSTEAKSLPS